MIERATTSDFPAVVNVWEASVRATHDFLPEDYLQHIKQILPSILSQVPVYISRNESKHVVAFLGVAERSIEMLFVHPQMMGRGIGKNLIQFAIRELEANRVEVNEQNPQAKAFYEKMGFVVTGRKDLDGLGKPFPLLEMELTS